MLKINCYKELAVYKRKNPKIIKEVK